MKLSTLAFGFLTAATTLSACSSSDSKPNLPKLTVGTVPWAGWSALDVAKAKGFFEEEGVDLEVRNYQINGDTNLIEAIANGDIDCGFYMQGTLLTYAMEQNKPITFLGEVDWSYGGDQIIVRPPLENAVAALRAKTKKSARTRLQRVTCCSSTTIFATSRDIRGRLISQSSISSSAIPI
jgi:NitT/TauT family transport system substrate-binding protein